MKFIKDNKMLLGGLLFIGLLLYVYFNYFRGSSDTNLLTSSADSSVASPELLATLSSLHTITLDASLFTDEVFLSLTDFGVTIPPQNVGRRNPFAPLTTVK
ncbi:hypothetical protein H7X87_03540 [Acetobacteraceae bacterium]|nr:hypothetical protein [Candidatus Parcubacteria bacterium]